MAVSLQGRKYVSADLIELADSCTMEVELMR